MCSIIPAGIVCRNNANNFCDVREQCDGISLNCPADLGKNQGLVCNTTTGTVCPANDASGAPHACP